MSDEPDVITLNDDDTVVFGETGLTTSGRVLRLVAEDMFGLTVDWYIKDAQRGAQIRFAERRERCPQPRAGEGSGE